MTEAVDCDDMPIMAIGVCQIAHRNLARITCTARESHGYLCERIDPHVEGHRIGDHTINHAGSGSGYACGDQ